MAAIDCKIDLFIPFSKKKCQKTAVKQDLFHIVQRFTKILKERNPIHCELTQDYGKIFHDPQDIGDM